MDNEIERKLRIENLTRCMNCSAFVTCKECEKENVVDCDHFVEIADEEQIVIISLCEWAKGKQHNN